MTYISFLNVEVPPVKPYVIGKAYWCERCNRPLSYADGRYWCRRCQAEVKRLNERGYEKWTKNNG